MSILVKWNYFSYYQPFKWCKETFSDGDWYYDRVSFQFVFRNNEDATLFMLKFNTTNHPDGNF